jgi:hypothetical protein
MIFFKNYNNLIKSETKPIMNLNSQSIQYQRIKSKKKIEKKKSLTRQTCEQIHELYKV